MDFVAIDTQKLLRHLVWPMVAFPWCLAWYFAGFCIALEWHLVDRV